MPAEANSNGIDANTRLVIEIPSEIPELSEFDREIRQLAADLSQLEISYVARSPSGRKALVEEFVVGVASSIIASIICAVVKGLLRSNTSRKPEQVLDVLRSELLIRGINSWEVEKTIGLEEWRNRSSSILKIIVRPKGSEKRLRIYVESKSDHVLLNLFQ